MRLPVDAYNRWLPSFCRHDQRITTSTKILYHFIGYKKVSNKTLGGATCVTGRAHHTPCVGMPTKPSTGSVQKPKQISGLLIGSANTTTGA
ncbi:hypothetical protein O988_08430 [Pseudogymnoascus sp. VKM F-3808]|nr:hypothetical protein O988_08430 [Pseudogymnoascus sp. VKM F-3808]